MSFRGSIAAPEGRIEFHGRVDSDGCYRPALAGTLDAFLVERYVAWTHRHGVARRFRIRHAPWAQARAEVTVTRANLLACVCGGLLVPARPALAHYSPGTFDVAIGPPERR